MKRDRLLMAYQNSRWLLFGLLTVAVLGVGCTKSYMNHTRLAPTDLAPDDAITVIQVQSGDQEDSDEVEGKVLRCIKNTLWDTHRTVRVIPPDEFRRVAFPDLSSAEILSGDASGEWDQLTKDPSLAARITSLGIRYLITVSGGTTTDSKFRMEGSFNGGVYWVEWDRHSVLRATIIDLRQGRKAGIVDASVSGKGAWVFPPFPLIFPVATEGPACIRLAEEVIEFLAGEKPPAEMKTEQLEEEIREEWERTKDEDQQGQFIGHGYAPTPFE